MSHDDDLPVVKVGDVFTTPRKPGQKFVAYTITRMDADDGVLLYSINIDGWSYSWGNKKNITTTRQWVQNGSWRRIELRKDQLVAAPRFGSTIDYSSLAKARRAIRGRRDRLVSETPRNHQGQRWGCLWRSRAVAH